MGAEGHQRKLAAGGWPLLAGVFAIIMAFLLVDSRFRLYGLPYYDCVALVLFGVVALSFLKSPADLEKAGWRPLLVRMLPLWLLISVVELWFAVPEGYESADFIRVGDRALLRVLFSTGMYVLGWLAVRKNPRAAYVVGWAWIASLLVLGVVTLDQLDSVRSRFTGWFEDPNYFAGYVAAATTVVLAWTLAPTSGWKAWAGRLLAGVAALGGAAAIALSYSRGGVLTLATGVGATAVAFVISYGLRAWRILPAMAGIAVVALWIVQNSRLSSLAGRLTISSALETGGTGRVKIWQMAWDHLWGHPAGTGIGTRVYWGALERYMATHNALLEMGVQLGLLGLAVGCWFLLVQGYDSLRLLRAADPRARAFGAAGIALLVCAMTLDVLTWRHYWFVMGLIGGMATALPRSTERPAASQDGPGRRGGVSPGAVG